ncbi:hypothetical protein V2J09_018775 [Rumex salicifolius]
MRISHADGESPGFREASDLDGQTIGLQARGNKLAKHLTFLLTDVAAEMVEVFAAVACRLGDRDPDGVPVGVYQLRRGGPRPGDV